MKKKNSSVGTTTQTTSKSDNPTRKKTAQSQSGKTNAISNSKKIENSEEKKTTTKERNIPKKVEANSLADYFEVMSIAVFQASVSWALILNKLDNFRKAFNNFDPNLVAKYDEIKISSLMEDSSILRNEKKIRATVTNAACMLELTKQHGSFANYLHSFKDYLTLAKDMKKRFKFFGDLSVYYFLFRVNEPVPDFDEWIETIPGEHPRMREMVDQYRIPPG